MEDDTNRSDDRGARGGRLGRAAVVAGALALLVAAAGLLAPETDGSGDEPHAPALRSWDPIGCWDLRVAPWRVVWRDDAAGGGARPGRDGAAGDRRGDRGRAAPSSERPGGDVPASFAPPDRLMLLPDSADRWARALPSRRAVPRSGPDRPGRSLRWTVRADTLWLLWSEGDVRAGVALRPSGDSLTGRVRTVRGGDSLDATAAASARRINCSTGAPEPAFGREIDRR